jgi:hypothetical protein
MEFALELIMIFVATALGVMGGLGIGELATKSRRRRELNQKVQELLDSYGVEYSEEVPKKDSSMQ